MLLHKVKFKIKSNKALLLDPLIDGYKAKPFFILNFCALSKAVAVVIPI
jgi:hypothetical protein